MSSSNPTVTSDMGYQNSFVFVIFPVTTTERSLILLLEATLLPVGHSLGVG